MKINSPKNYKKIIIISAAVIVVAGTATLLALNTVFKQPAINNDPNNRTINYEPPTDDQKNAGGDIKANSVDSNDTTKPNSSGSDQAADPVLQANGKGKVTATMTSANQNNTTAQIRFEIGAVTNTGTCTMKLTKDTIIVTKTADVQALAGSSACKGFDVPVSELNPGIWSIGMHFENSTLVADTTGSVTIK